MSVIAFVRHGQSEANALGMLSNDMERFPLTALGVAQAEHAGRQLTKFRVSKVFASPFLRARQTAHIIAREIGTDGILIDERLGELGFGKRNNTMWTEGWITALERIPGRDGVETMESVHNRMLSFSNSLKDENAVVVAVSHGTPLQTICGSLMGITNETQISKIEMKNCAISVMGFEEGAPVLLGTGMKDIAEPVTGRIRSLLRD